MGWFLAMSDGPWYQNSVQAVSSLGEVLDDIEGRAVVDSTVGKM